MSIKRGNVVSHTGAVHWGIGKVMEVSAFNATIQFSDGSIRKIASSHYTTLQPADSALFVSPATGVVAPKIRATVKREKKLKAPAAL
jgi:transcription elongation factor GreA-like protein